MPAKYKYIAQTSVAISAPVHRIWDALVNPALIKKYFLGVDVETNWTVGSPIRYKGIWEGKPFEDKGIIRELVPEKKIVLDFWSPFSGLPDHPENFQKITYDISRLNGDVGLTITQENIPSEESKAATERNWLVVLNNLKKLLEETNQPR